MANPPKTKPKPPKPKPKRVNTSKAVPVNDKQGYGYGRGKGTPTFNMGPAIKAQALVKFRASERSSAAKVTGRSNAKKVVGHGATVGDAINAVGKAVSGAAWGVNRGVQGALKSSPGLRSKGIENVMKLPPKRKK